MRRRFGEAMTGEFDGVRYELRRDGRKRFELVGSGAVLATAQAARRGRWEVMLDGSAYELRRRSAWGSDMELRRDSTVVGRIRKGRATRGKIVCELPPELSPVQQTFVGLVVLNLWNRAAAGSGAAVATASG